MTSQLYTDTPIRIPLAGGQYNWLARSEVASKAFFLTPCQGCYSLSPIVLKILELFDGVDDCHFMASGTGKLCLPRWNNDSRAAGFELRGICFRKMAWYSVVLCHHCFQSVCQHLLRASASENRSHGAIYSCDWVFWHLNSLGISCSARLNPGRLRHFQQRWGLGYKRTVLFYRTVHEHVCFYRYVTLEGNRGRHC